MTAVVKSVEQAKQLENPDARIVFEEINEITLLETEVLQSELKRVKIPAASGGAFRAGGHSADMARSASTCPSKEAVCSVGGICPPNPLTRMPFLPTASSGATWHDFV